MIHQQADPVAGKGGARKMKSMWPPLAAIFFMTNFYRAGGTPWPLDPLLTAVQQSTYELHSSLSLCGSTCHREQHLFFENCGCIRINILMKQTQLYICTLKNFILEVFCVVCARSD